METYEARLNVTYDQTNGDLPDPVRFDATDAEVLAWVTEAIRTGGIPGITVDPNASLVNYVVDRFVATEDVPYNRLSVRPKTPFG